MNSFPTITFTAVIAPPKTETFGTSTNQTNVMPLSPVMLFNGNGLTNYDNRAAQMSTWLPGLSGGDMETLSNGKTVTLYGEAALYVKNTYGIGVAPAERAWLKFVIS